MVTGIMFKPDMSFIKIKNLKTYQNFVKYRGDYIQYSWGQSVFKERRKLTELWKFWKKPEVYILWWEGANSAFKCYFKEPELQEGDSPEEKIKKLMVSNAKWSKEESSEYINKQTAKIQASKMLGGWRFWALIGVNILVLAYLFMRFH